MIEDPCADNPLTLPVEFDVFVTARAIKNAQAVAGHGDTLSLQFRRNISRPSFAPPDWGLRVNSDPVRAQSRERFSELLDRMAHPAGADRISFGEALESVGDRAFGALLLVFAIPNIIAGAVPGVSALLGLPLMLLSLQLVTGASRPWLPPRIRARTAKRADLARVVEFIRRPCQWVERLLKPRLLILTSSWAERCIGAVCALAACVLFLPIPFANLLPALTLCLFGLALLERDGMFVVMGTAAFTVTIVALVGGIYSLQELATDTWPMAFGTP